MKLATFNRYQDGQNTKIEVALPDHVVITGKEDSFDLAYHDARMILCGLRTANPDATWCICSIDLQW
jgi:hypothetical protein